MTRQEEHQQFRDAMEDARKSYDALMGHLDKLRRGIRNEVPEEVSTAAQALLLKHSPDNPNKPKKEKP